jgi:hypothetical protein
MPKIGEIFGSYFKIETLNGKPLKLLIDSVEIQEFKDEKTGKMKNKPVLFGDALGGKGFVAGTEVANQIAEILGDDNTDGWPGGWIEIFQTTTKFAGKTVPCMRARKPAAVSANGQRSVVREIKPADAKPAREVNQEKPPAPDLADRNDDADGFDPLD